MRLEHRDMGEGFTHHDGRDCPCKPWRIVTQYWAKPMGTRQFDWQAVTDDYEAEWEDERGWGQRPPHRPRSNQGSRHRRSAGATEGAGRMLTEEEARARWCPFARVSQRVVAPNGTRPISATYNRVADRVYEGDEQTAKTGLLTYKETKIDHFPESCNCVASDCMAWRWGEPREIGTDRTCERCNGSGVIVVGSGETAGGEECPACVCGYQTEAVPTGFCGLAGQPSN